MRSDHARLRARAVAAFESGVEAADPRRAVREGIEISDSGRPVIAGEELSGDATLRAVSMGKAAIGMAEGLLEVVPAADFPGPGVVVVNLESSRQLSRFRVLTAGHPEPDAAGVAAGVEIERYLEGSVESDALIVMISGGGSALVPAPSPDISLQDKVDTTRLLLACGASIQEINSVRKHLSSLKGGGLARLAWPSRVESLILSDVIGDDLSSIASGPTTPDPTTFSDAVEVLDRHNLWRSVPGAVQRRLQRGVDGDIPETPTDGDAIFSRVSNRVIGSNAQSLAAVKRSLEELGFRVVIASSDLQGEAREAAAVLLRAAHEARREPTALAVLAGGETTVTLRGQGVGGRNQELALAFALLCEGDPPFGTWTFLSGGTDGRDGPTEAAGGVVDPDTLMRIREAGLDPQSELDENNSHPALAAANDLLMTGPTGTNVADLQILLLSAGSLPK